MSLSCITVSGTLKKDPEKRFTPSNIPVTNLLLEVCYIPRTSVSQPVRTISTQLIRINAWRDLADECERKLKAGDKILVIGRAQINAYTTNDGKKKREVEIDANSVTLLQDILSMQVPLAKEVEEKPQSKFKSTSQDVEAVTNLDELVSNTEEIPF